MYSIIHVIKDLKNLEGEFEYLETLEMEKEIKLAFVEDSAKLERVNWKYPKTNKIAGYKINHGNENLSLI